MPSSMVWPEASRNRTWWAWRTRSPVAHSACATSWLRGPDRRTMPTPPWPAGVAIAAMVSPAAMASGLGGRLAILAQHPPLLQQAEAAVGDPVQDQARREEGEHHAHRHRHVLHHLALHRIGDRRRRQLLGREHHHDVDRRQDEVRVRGGEVLYPADPDRKS